MPAASVRQLGDRVGDLPVLCALQMRLTAASPVDSGWNIRRPSRPSPSRPAAAQHRKVITSGRAPTLVTAVAPAATPAASAAAGPRRQPGGEQARRERVSRAGRVEPPSPPGRPRPRCAVDAHPPRPAAPRATGVARTRTAGARPPCASSALAAACPRRAPRTGTPAATPRSGAADARRRSPSPALADAASARSPRRATARPNGTRTGRCVAWARRPASVASSAASKVRAAVGASCGARPGPARTVPVGAPHAGHGQATPAARSSAIRAAPARRRRPRYQGHGTPNESSHAAVSRLPRREPERRGGVGVRAGGASARPGRGDDVPATRTLTPRRPRCARESACAG